ncbi:hypothetical protein BJ085DRAFT_29353 [Dimargaris cristalligena]|uniref:Uncharacterized protein n=1 Tax=Dimargaris cristalligena TaxID=215637 RepID=A0A4P9ZQF5_9FUNG|nr:hypothetical protein BJ085DRAFT_29353 [Dimargaris cristalligena]|eukprot:RKP35716.1 hypothetical protein BJ085DRAFT_29353 [Dimargaris cristalligena]
MTCFNRFGKYCRVYEPNVNGEHNILQNQSLESRPSYWAAVITLLGFLRELECSPVYEPTSVSSKSPNPMSLELIVNDLAAPSGSSHTPNLSASLSSAKPNPMSLDFIVSDFGASSDSSVEPNMAQHPDNNSPDITDTDKMDTATLIFVT